MHVFEGVVESNATIEGQRVFVSLSVNSVIPYGSSSSLLWLFDPSEIESEWVLMSGCHQCFMDAKLGLTRDDTAEMTWGFPLTLSLSTSSTQQWVQVSSMGSTND